MAAAEARAAWQRTANRCFVQEDAKRAPKLACCPSSSFLQQYDSSNGNTNNGQDHPSPGFMPLNWNPMNSNLPPDTKWWLQLQPNFGYEKDFACEHLNALGDEIEETKIEARIPSSKRTGEPNVGGLMDIESKEIDHFIENTFMVSTTFMKHDSERRVEDVKTAYSTSQHTVKRKDDMSDYLYCEEKLINPKSVEALFSRKHENGFFDMEEPWGGNNCEPWWRVADKDELASLVAQKSQQHIENCDLPRPKKISRDPFPCSESLDNNGIFRASVGCSIDEKHWSSSDLGYSLYTTEKLYSGKQSFRTAASDPPESKPAFKNDPGRAQLLEALRHSQTRAREAELAAQKAYSEKEHVIKLLFRQASHLFAYKQWLRMLQQESLCLQLRIRQHQIPIPFPVVPWTPLKRKPSKEGKKQRSRCSVCKYAILFAVGLGLAGAGLLLGWTLGWLLPGF